MTKRIGLLILCVFSLLAALLLFTGCMDNSTLPEGYVEVETLRVSDANIYLSPSGTTSVYQMQVEILPSNATNQNLSYFIPAEYRKYISVDRNGLITALLITPDDVFVPLTVTSTSNKNATRTVKVVVEVASVEEIYFEPGELSLLLYTSGNVQLAAKYRPHHATDGINFTYISQRPEIATVTPTGLLTPVGVGTVHIQVTGETMLGKTIEGFLKVTIQYSGAEVQYRLDVSEPNPAYKQVIGSPRPITFTLARLDDNSDPNPRIQWYVNGNREISMDGQYQFEHIPLGNTVIDYCVTVKVKAEGREEETLTSERIYLYNRFSGFQFNTLNQTSGKTAYAYKSEQTFTVYRGSDEEITAYQWYLKRIGASGNGILVGVTAVQDGMGVFTRRLNIEGDYVLTAQGVTAEQMIATTTMFEFSVLRFVNGDTLAIDPVVLNSGIPPESYVWEKYYVDSNGNRSTDNIYVGTTAYGKTLYYPLNSESNVVLVAHAMLDGRIATVPSGGKETNFYYETGILSVYSYGSADVPDAQDIVDGADKSLYDYRIKAVSAIDNLRIEGIRSGSEYLVQIHWAQQIRGARQYVAEIIKEDGTILFLDSAVSTGFGDNYVIIPTNVVKLTDKFSVRVKQKGGLFSERYYYGYTPGYDDDASYYFATVPTSLYAYLSAVKGNMNTYISDMKDLAELMEYILLFRPTASSLIGYKTSTAGGELRYEFTVRMFLAFDFQTVAASYHLDDSRFVSVAAEFVTLHKMLIAAQSAYVGAGNYSVSINSYADGSYGVTFILGAVEVPAESTGSIVRGETLSSAYYAAQPYGAGHTVFAIDSRPESEVSTSEALFAVAENGKRPKPMTEVTLAIYNAAKAVVCSVVGEGMSDAEKVLAFYDYLTLNIVYDTNLLDKLLSETEKLYAYESFHLDGVFLQKKAVCDGIAKAVVLLCAIEGIPAVKVNGTVNDIGHAWNMVQIEGYWYHLDATWGVFLEQSELKQYANHDYFLFGDDDFDRLYGENTLLREGEYPAARTGINFFTLFQIGGSQMTINSAAQLIALADGFNVTAAGAITLEIKLTEQALNGNTEGDFLQGIILSGNKRIGATFLNFGAGRVIITIKTV